MKRPVTLLLVAALLASGAAYAKNDKEKFAERVAHKAMRTDEARRDVQRQRVENHRERRDDRHDRNDHRRDHRPAAPRHGNDWPDHARRDWDRRDNRGWHRARSDWDRHPNYWDNRRHDRRDYARFRYHYGVYHAPRGYYRHVWHRGDRLPRGWYGSSYIVHDWRPYRLYSPPYGYHWVRVGNDVILTAVATGIVLDVLYDIWY